MVRPTFCAILLLIVCTSAQGGNNEDDAAETANEAKVPAFEPDATITLTQAWAAALAGNPEIAAYQWEVRAQEGTALQAGLAPNPEFGFLVEEFGGSDSRNGFNAAETTLQLSQKLQTGGKRPKNWKVAALGKELAQWDYQSRSLDVLAAASGAFSEVLAYQEKQDLMDQLVRIAEQTVQTMTARVSAGKAPLLEQTKADVSLSFVKIEQERTLQALEVARNRLAATWSGHANDFHAVKGEFYRRGPLPDLGKIRKRLADNPDWIRWESELSQRRAKTELEKAKRYPDVTVIAGAKNFQDEPGTAMIVGLSVPLPLFDRNQGGIAESEARLRQGQFQARAARVRLETELEQIYRKLASAAKQVEALENRVIPGIEQAFQTAQQGYAEGKFNSLDVLDAQRTLFEARMQYIDTLLAYHQVYVELARLAGVFPEIVDDAAAAAAGEKQ
jgi:outer membrane protein, heavy metal efflux system